VNDGDTVETYDYLNGAHNSEMLFYKVRGGGHTWMYAPSYDIDYSVEIWKFFRKHVNNVYSINESPDVVKNITVYPNPASDHIDMQIPNIAPGETLYYQLFNMQGQSVIKGQIDNFFYHIQLDGLNNGIYLLRIYDAGSQSAQRIIIAR
jgi:hypothetical protein